jgi:hypothetical protein
MGSTYPTKNPRSAGALLKAYWKKRKNTWYRIGPKLRPGASERELYRFESKYGVRLPGDMRTYFALMDGMEFASSEGEWMFSFWELGRVRPLTEEFGKTADEQYLKIPQAESYFAFADSMIESEVYSTFLSADPAARNVVIGYAGVRRAESFSEFAMRYMRDANQLI